jgi:hypothetical protein
VKLEVLVQVSCDACPASALAVDHALPAGWFVGTLTFGSVPRECHICPQCSGNLIDPPDDIAGELRRFDLEARIA